MPRVMLLDWWFGFALHLPRTLVTSAFAALSNGSRPHSGMHFGVASCTLACCMARSREPRAAALEQCAVSASRGPAPAGPWTPRAGALGAGRPAHGCAGGVRVHRASSIVESLGPVPRANPCGVVAFVRGAMLLRIKGTVVKDVELKQVLKSLTQALDDPGTGPDQRMMLQRAKRDFQEMAQAGKFDKAKVYRAADMIARAYLQLLELPQA